MDHGLERSGLIGNRPGRLFFTIGLPRSGKSTIANAWATSGDDDFCVSPRVVLGGDDFRLALHGQEYHRDAEGMVFATIDVAARALLSRGHDVLIDETCTTEQTLLRYLLIDIDATPILVETSEEECVRRALDNNMDYLVAPIRHMARQMRELLRGWPEAIHRVRRHIRCRYHNDSIPVEVLP